MSQQKAVTKYNTLRDWNRCTVSNITKSSTGFYMTAAGSGTLTTPVVDGTKGSGTMSSWGEFLISFKTGSSATYYVRSSSDSVTWTVWESLSRGRLPMSTAAQRYFQLKIELTDTNVTVE